MTQLIMLDTPIIVNDERIKPGDWYITNLSNIYQETERMFEDDEGKPRFHYPQYKKIIAGIEGLPSIDWNGLEEEFGWIDVKKLSKVDIKSHHKNIQKREIDYILGYEDGFNKAQSLNKKKFSLEAMFKCFQAGIDYEKEGSILQPDAHGYIRSLQQPKVFDIEVEMYRPNEAYQISEHWSPKITNNSIKIIKKL